MQVPLALTGDATGLWSAWVRGDAWVAMGPILLGIAMSVKGTTASKIGMMWDLKVRKLDDKTCEFTSTVHSSATPELEDFLGKQGIPWEVFKAARKPISEAHNR
jgi:hypothetical protein